MTCACEMAKLEHHFLPLSLSITSSQELDNLLGDTIVATRRYNGFHSHGPSRALFLPNIPFLIWDMHVVEQFVVTRLVKAARVSRGCTCHTCKALYRVVFPLSAPSPPSFSFLFLFPIALGSGVWR